ncbi:MAG: TA system VapC family ribonuclease toxin [Beutenbergiaceae bacterium]
MARRGTLFDVNALVALCLTTHLHHRAAHRFLATLHNPWYTTPITEAALYRLLLNPAITGSPRMFAEVDSVVQGLRTHPTWNLLADDSTLTQASVTTAVLTGHQQVTDLHLVNLSAKHLLTLATFDRGMLQWLAPADHQHVQIIPT